MDRFQEQPAVQTTTRISTPLTDSAQFVITAKDVGSAAVRPGLMADMERERLMLLSAAKLVLGRVRAGNVAIGAPYEYALEQAIKLAELPR